MTRKLDFVVFGVPRGGTTAVANYISAARGFHCGVEVFPTYMDHSTLDVPDAFLTRQHAQWLDTSVQAVRDNLDTLRVYGNKTPTYFYRLPSLLEELDNCPVIACVRDPREVASSYTKRATNPDDPWVRGRIGLFAMGDAILMLHALHRAPPDANIMILPQAALLADWRAVMTRALAHIAPGTEPDFDPEALQRINGIKKRAARTEKPELTGVEERALKRLRRDGLVDFFARTDVVMLNDVREEIAEIIVRMPPNPVGFIRRLAGEHPDPEVETFFERWSRQASRAWRLYRDMGDPAKT
ncbi:sulfotransferase [Seohaeicola saemankumensis]|nr:sulfotransferase [Seohaeicola saemankumensis]MCA0873433.1 sulfotransferase [Seohaeicola saemankumensis]